MKRQNIQAGVDLHNKIVAREASLKRLSSSLPRLVIFERNVLDDIDLPLELREIFGTLAAAQIQKEISELEDQLEAL